MRKIIRTANCPKCGSVKLKILSGNGKIDYFCNECKMNIKTISCEKFTSISSKCKQCGNDIFKVKIQEKNGEELWNPFCCKCNGQASLICIDNQGNEFNINKREVIEILSSMNLFESKLLKLESSVYDFNKKVEKLKKKVELTYEYRFK
ncbi:hypothetical protein [Clostridium akagii]|uniref:hypothetical protein n=1 Tax=Clostridium akagii TaxID=91623 RepID=UPI00047AAFEE|nr:hypothetical protein [Clostridium akagii]